MAVIVLEHPTSNLQRANRLATQQLADTLLEHSEMEKMGKKAVDKWRPKRATELSAHVLTIPDKLDQHIRTEPCVTVELSSVASWFAMTLLVASVVCFHELGAMGTMQLYMKN